MALFLEFLAQEWILVLALLAVAGLGFELTRNDAPPPRLMSFEIDVPGEEDIAVGTRNNVLLSPDGGLMGWLTPQASTCASWASARCGYSRALRMR